MSVDLDSEQAPQLLQSLSAALAEIVTNPHTPPGLSATCFNIVAQLTSALASLSGTNQRQVGLLRHPTRHMAALPPHAQQHQSLPASTRLQSCFFPPDGNDPACWPSVPNLPHYYSKFDTEASVVPANGQFLGLTIVSCHAYIPACRFGTCWRPWCSRGSRLCVVCWAQTPQHGPPGRSSWLHCASAMQLRPTSASPWQQRCHH